MLVPDWVTHGLQEHGIRAVPSMRALRRKLEEIRGDGERVSKE